MALITGRRAGGSSVSRIALSLCFLLAGGLCLAVAFVSAPVLGAVAGAALAAAALGGVAAMLSLRRAGRLARQVETLSGEIDLLSRRLLTLEQREVPAVPAANLENGLSEVTAEIGLLGGIVRELAMAVAAQDEDLTRLKAGSGAAAQPAPIQAPPAPVQAPPAQAAPVAHPGAAEAAAAPLPAPRATPTRPPQAHAAAPFVTPAPVQAAPSWPVEAAAASPAPSVAPSPSLSSFPADPILPREAAPAPRRPFVPEPAAEAHPEAEILAALSQGLEVHLQPVVSLPQRKVAFYEALARLRVGDALLSPAE
ncbi:hypothetical protein CS379_13335, partial [Methylobacterium frigidaeris]